VATRLDNQFGWHGIGDTARRCDDVLSVPTVDLAQRLGTVYDVALELGSYLELNQKLQSAPDTIGVPLEPEAYRSLADLVRTLGPWIRRFPTIRKLDDEAGSFLSKIDLYEPAMSLAVSAEVTGLISRSDAIQLRAIVEAAQRGEFQGQKAGNRGIASARNLVLAAGGVLSTFFLGALSSDYATKSPIVSRAGTFIQTSERELLELFASFPLDLQQALQSMLGDLHGTPNPDDPTPPLFGIEAERPKDDDY
jgi:hypothetical protein